MLSMITVKAGVERIEGLMTLISREPRALAPPFGRIQNDTKATKVVGEKTCRSKKIKPLLKKNAVGKGARRKVQTHEASIRFLLSGLGRVRRPSSLPHVRIPS